MILCPGYIKYGNRRINRYANTWKLYHMSITAVINHYRCTNLFREYRRLTRLYNLGLEKLSFVFKPGNSFPYCNCSIINYYTLIRHNICLKTVRLLDFHVQIWVFRLLWKDEARQFILIVL